MREEEIREAFQWALDNDHIRVVRAYGSIASLRRRIKENE